MFGYGDGRPDGIFGVLLGIGWGITAFIGFLIWLAVVILLVRFLVIATRAAKLYLAQSGHDAGLFPKRPAPPTAPAATQSTTAAQPPAPKPAVKPAAKPASKPAAKPRKPAGS